MESMRLLAGRSRRQFVQAVGAGALGLLAGCGRLPGRPQASARLPQIGYFGSEPSRSINPSFDNAFLEGLHEHGLIENQSVALTYPPSGDLAHVPEAAAALIETGPDVIVTTNNALVEAVKNATSSIPIVGLTMSYPVEVGLVASLARPGGNVTGLTSDTGPGLRAKRLELLRDIAPHLSRVAMLYDPVDPSGIPILEETQDGARTLGVQVQAVPVRNEGELNSAFEAIVREHADAINIIGGPLLLRHRKRIADFAIERRLPSITARRDQAEAGILMVYGPSFDGLARRGAAYVDRILSGTKPADLPVEQPREFEFIINLKTAQALGLTIPQHVLLQATEVIQ